MIELLIVAGIASLFIGAAGSCMAYTYKEERKKILAIRGASELERKLPPSLPPTQQPERAEQQAASPWQAQARSLAPPLAQPIVEIPQKQLPPLEALWLRLVEHEGGWILDILERPILIWGAQGSYKSYFAAFLALLRILFKGHQVEINDPHILLNRDKAWKALLACGVPGYGSKTIGTKEEGFNYLAIAKRIDAFTNRLRTATNTKQWHSPIFDEVSQYAFEPDIKDVASTLMLKCLSDCRKGREAPILLAHNNTQALTGGSTGTHQAKEEGLAQLHLYSTSKNGEYYPLFKGELTGIPNERGKLVVREVSLAPDWMNPEILLAQFPELSQHAARLPKEESDITPETASNSADLPPDITKNTEDVTLNDERSKLDFLFSLPSETPQHELPLAPHLAAILRYARKRGGSVKFRDIQPAKIPELEGFSAEQIRTAFAELALLRRATVTGEGGNMTLSLGARE